MKTFVSAGGANFSSAPVTLSSIGVAFRHVNRALLVAAKNALKLVAHSAQLVVDVKRSAAGITEYRVSAFFQQRLAKYSRAAHCFMRRRVFQFLRGRLS
jgi:hypothetical protein